MHLHMQISDQARSFMRGAPAQLFSDQCRAPVPKASCHYAVNERWLHTVLVLTWVSQPHAHSQH
jgi:hypothetical protein